MISISCGNKVTEDELKALTQQERKRLNQIARLLMAEGRHLVLQKAIEKA